MANLGSNSWTYLVVHDDKSDHRMKIGKTTERDPWNRISSLETGAGIKLQWFGFIRDSMHEKPLHRHLKQWRVKGEWFQAPDEMLRMATEYLQQYGEVGEPYEIAESDEVSLQRAGRMTSDRHKERRRRRIKKQIASGKPLPMFTRSGEGYAAADIELHIKIGNALHLIDLRQEQLRANVS